MSRYFNFFHFPDTLGGMTPNLFSVIGKYFQLVGWPILVNVFTWQSVPRLVGNLFNPPVPNFNPPSNLKQPHHRPLDTGNQSHTLCCSWVSTSFREEGKLKFKSVFPLKENYDQTAQMPTFNCWSMRSIFLSNRIAQSWTQTSSSRRGPSKKVQQI